MCLFVGELGGVFVAVHLKLHQTNTMLCCSIVCAQEEEVRRAAEEKQRAEDEEASKWMNMISVEDTVRGTHKQQSGLGASHKPPYKGWGALSHDTPLNLAESAFAGHLKVLKQPLTPPPCRKWLPPPPRDGLWCTPS